METLGIVATAPENARLYFKYRPTPLRLAADPEMSTHRAYGLPKPAVTPEFMKDMQDDTDQFLRRVSRAAAHTGGRRRPGEAGRPHRDTDKADVNRQFPQLRGQFLIDRAGIVRWPTSSAAPRASRAPGSPRRRRRSSPPPTPCRASNAVESPTGSSDRDRGYAAPGLYPKGIVSGFVE